MEKKQRVPKGEKYWYVFIYCDDVTVDFTIENGRGEDYARRELGNYFATMEEAKSMARKIHAVLKGADVIEMPSEEEISKRPAQTNPFDTSEHEGTLAGYTNGAHNGYFKGYADCLNWIKSKIVK